jgi:hypothetical protein
MSEYICANCGEYSGMYGHFSGSMFSCVKNPGLYEQRMKEFAEERRKKEAQTEAGAREQQKNRLEEILKSGKR